MSKWSAGYVSELDYVFSYIEELNTNRVNFCLLNKGIQSPKISQALELGFGQGISINIHAAASDVVWYGTDFNPGQTNFARNLAIESGVEAHLYDDSFEQLLSNRDLPEFQFIALHGIWSWISDKNREVIVDIIRTKLAVGGVVYLSYNTYPGWSSFSPMRHLMTQHSRVLGNNGEGLARRISNAFEFGERLIELNPSYLRANSNVKARIGAMKAQNSHYLAHEFFNQDWHPMYFSEVAEVLCEAKLEFAGSAEFADQVDEINFTAEQREFIAEAADPIFRESVKDFMLNRQFRRDYWVKGPLRLDPFERATKLRKVQVVLKTAPHEITFKMQGGVGEVSLNPSRYQPIINYLSDQKIKSIGEIEAHCATENKDSAPIIKLAEIVQSVTLLLGTGQLALAQPEEVISKARKTARALNETLLDKAKSGRDMGIVASPVTASGVTANRIEQLFLIAINNGASEPHLWAETAWAVLSSQGQKLIVNEVMLDSDEANLNELIEKAINFEQKRLTTFRALGVIC